MAENSDLTSSSPISREGLNVSSNRTRRKVIDFFFFS